MIKVSVILSVYNKENSLNDSLCIESILTQTFTDFELIIINDGSTDRSGQIADQYATKDNRISVIHRTNQDLGASYNTGVRSATGQYIVFVEPDDFLHERFLDVHLAEIKQSHADISLCDFFPIEEGVQIDDNQRKETLSDIKRTIKTGSDALPDIYEIERLYTVPWSKVYRKSLFSDIIFPEGYVDPEEFIAHRLLYKAKKIVHVHVPMYYYVIKEGRKGSYTPIPMTAEKFDKMQALYERVQFFKEKQLKTLEERALIHFTEHFFWYYIQSQHELPEAIARRKEIKKMYKKLFLSMIKNSQISNKEKIVYTAFRISPNFHKLLVTRVENKRLKRSS